MSARVTASEQAWWTVTRVPKKSTSTGTSTSTSTEWRSTYLSYLMFHEDLANASRRAEQANGVKRKADIPLGKTPSKSPRLLGPILGERFKALGTRIARHL